MANHKSAQKRDRQNVKKREHNRSARSAIRSAIRDAREIISTSSQKTDGGDVGKEKLTSAVRQAEKMLAKAASKGLFSKKAASRTTSRLAKRAAKSQK